MVDTKAAAADDSKDKDYFAFLWNDLLFKLVFTKPDLLKTLVACVLDIPEEHITELSIDNSEIPSDINMLKTARLDIRLSFKILEEHTLCDVEMQVIVGSDFPKRAVFYVRRMQDNELRQGSDYVELKKAYGIFFLLENIFKSPNYHNIGVQTLLGTNEVVDDGFEMHYIELQKIDFEAGIDDSDTRMQLFRLLKINTRKELADMDAVRNPKVENVLSYMRMYNADPKMRNMMQAHEDGLFNMQMSLSTRYKEGRAKGRAEGRAEERAVAERKLHEQAKEAESKLHIELHTQAVEFAQSLLAQNLPLDVIAAASKLSLEEVENLRK